MKPDLDLVKKTKHLWHCTYVELTKGWEKSNHWTIIWRSEKYHGKISWSGPLKKKSKPSDEVIQKILEHELNERFESSLDCDAKKVAMYFLTEPMDAEISGCQKEIEKLVTQQSDELGKILESVSDSVLGNELCQRVKDIAHAQESRDELRKFIERNLKK